MTIGDSEGRRRTLVRPEFIIMGVESKFYLLPDSSRYRPGPGEVIKLMLALRAARFLCDPKSPAYVAMAHRAASLSSQADYEGFSWRVGRDKVAGSLSALEQHLTDRRESDVRLCWRNSDLALSNLKYPLTVVPGPDGVYYDTELHLVADTVSQTSDIIDSFDQIHCSCGAVVDELEPPPVDLFCSARLPNDCPDCCEPMNYAALPVTMRDAWTGAESTGIGGVCYRFALVVDCGKYWPDCGAAVSPELLGIVEQTLQIKTRVVRDFY